jgi:RNA polymerase sigma-70 factor (ECF subfamily)
MGDDEQRGADRFLALLRPLERELEAYCRRLIWAVEDVPDAIQNAALRAVTAFERCHSEASFRPWMFKILTREILTVNRKHSRVARFEFQLEPEEIERLAEAAQPAEGLDDPRSWEAVSEALDQDLVAALKTLTDNERAVLLLRAVGDFRYREISEALEMPLGSVMGHLSRARHKMRSALSSPRRKIEPAKKPDRT